MYKQPSRILNESSQVLGLNANDLLCVGASFLIFQQIFVPFELELIPLLLLFIETIILITIRLKYRRKIIRDYGKFVFTKLFLNGKYYESKSN